MNDLFVSTPANWVLIILAAFIVGLSKAGLKGIDMLNVTIMTLVFGGKASTGVVLPLLCLADIMAVKYYHRHANWQQFWKLLPWMTVGILVGVIIGKDLNEALFRKVMAAIIVLTVVTVFTLEVRKTIFVPKNMFFAVSMGLIAGLATMLGNLAGAFSNLYFLALRIPKNDFIGTAAWLFLVINFFKLPFQILVWDNITLDSLKIDLILVPAVFLGFFTGIHFVSRVRDDNYRKAVIALTLCGALLIFFK